MATNPFVFDALISKTYDDLLGPFLFEPFALDLIERIGAHTPSTVLELACGTGRLTHHLLTHLPDSTEVTATDIDPGMLAIAQEKVLGPNIYWDTVDMAELPYDADEFELVVCQFGLMFVPDKVKALSEMRRVLKPGGRLICSTWGEMTDNPVWDIFTRVIGGFMRNLPANMARVPFSMSDEKNVLSMVAQAGFADTQAASVHKTGVCATAGDAARGLLIGSPVYNAIMQNSASSLPQMQTALEEAIGAALGERPVRSPLHAWVFNAVK
jgi:ubiquinone/menaquinone biosynthesis C-methylase UbiE